MFEERALSPEVKSVRDEHAPDALVLDSDSDFETLPDASLDDLALLTDAFDPSNYPSEWLPDDAPELLRRFASSDLIIGMPGDGSVVWTRQTDPPLVIVKARTSGSPETFVDFLIAEALVELGLDVPEQFLEFFGERYTALDAALPFGPADTYQIANALYDGYLGLLTRDEFANWRDDSPQLYDAWQDAGDRIEPRVRNLSKSVALGDTEFADAAELACSAIKHGIEPPTPFTALDSVAYRNYGAGYAVKWAEKTFADESDE